MKKAILIGKGPSAVEITKRQGFDIVALNNAVSLCEVVDYLFINDFEILDLINEDDWKKVKSLVIPIIPHYNQNPHPTKADRRRKKAGDGLFRGRGQLHFNVRKARSRGSPPNHRGVVQDRDG